jgi:hypothetical protein
MFGPMITTPLQTTANAEKIRRLQKMIEELLGQSLRSGFFGTVSVEMSIQDGTIQHLRRRLEQMEK